MSKYLKFILGTLPKRPVFVIGTGRSGTHWLGYSLCDHPEVRATIEKRPMFMLSTRMALNPELEGRLYKRLVAAYHWQLLKSYPRLYLDKSHPNIWLAEKLKASFPQALFLGIERNPFATVASMIKHKGVSSWHKRWKEFPIPNRFLGISAEQAKTYEEIPFAAQCAMRWVAHHTRMNELKKTLGDDLFVFSYEAFSHHTEETLKDLQRFLGLSQPIPIPDVKTESLDKWKSQLSPDEIQQIAKVVGFSPEALTPDEACVADSRADQVRR